MAIYKVTLTSQALCALKGGHVQRDRSAIAQCTHAAVHAGGVLVKVTGDLSPSGMHCFDPPTLIPTHIPLLSENYGPTSISGEEITLDDPQYSAGSVTCVASQADLHLLGVEYQFVDYSRVVRLLEENPYLISLLLEALIPLQAYLPGASLFLEVVNDPDALKGDELIVTARRDWTVEEALDALDKFDDAWWLDNIQRAAGNVTITVEHE